MSIKELFESGKDEEIPRRKFLAAAGATAGTAAGCLGNSGNPTKTATETEYTETQQAEGAQGAAGQGNTATETTYNPQTTTNTPTDTATPNNQTTTDPTQTETTENYTTETSSSNTTTGNNNSSTNTAELFNRLPDPNKLYETGAVNTAYFGSEELAKNLDFVGINVYNVEEMINDLDSETVEQLSEQTSNDVYGRGFVGAEWTDVINKTAMANGALGTVKLDMKYEEIIDRIENTDYHEYVAFREAGERNGRKLYETAGKRLSVEKGGNTLNWAATNRGDKSEPAEESKYGNGVLKDPEAALNILDQTVDGEINSYPEGDGKYNHIVKKTQEKTGEAQTASIGTYFENLDSVDPISEDFDDDGEQEITVAGTGMNFYNDQQVTATGGRFYIEEGAEGTKEDLKYAPSEEKTQHINPSDEKYNTLAGEER